MNGTIIADGLENSWGMDQLPDGSWIITERPGWMRLIFATGGISPPIDGLPEADARGQGGLLDVLVGDDFDVTRRVWWSYAEPRGNQQNATAVATGLLTLDGTTMTDVQVIFQQHPGWSSALHFGSRLIFDRDGALFITASERSLSVPRQLAQDVSAHLGRFFALIQWAGRQSEIPKLTVGCLRSGLGATVIFSRRRLAPMAHCGRWNTVRVAEMN